ncbi:MAG: hypothetical protein LUE17_09440 [Planctomycetaceae bacterium]|nr:hypothetical protein [Planctomycetaceae bacterium]
MKKVLVCLVNYDKYCTGGVDRLRAAGFDLCFNPHGRIFRPEELHPALADVDAVWRTTNCGTRRRIRRHPGSRLSPSSGSG